MQGECDGMFIVTVVQQYLHIYCTRFKIILSAGFILYFVIQYVLTDTPHESLHVKEIVLGTKHDR
jgi:hypothetical protein